MIKRLLQPGLPILATWLERDFDSMGLLTHKLNHVHTFGLKLLLCFEKCVRLEHMSRILGLRLKDEA